MTARWKTQATIAKMETVECCSVMSHENRHTRATAASRMLTCKVKNFSMAWPNAVASASSRSLRDWIWIDVFITLVGCLAMGDIKKRPPVPLSPNNQQVSSRGSALLIRKGSLSMG